MTNLEGRVILRQPRPRRRRRARRATSRSSARWPSAWVRASDFDSPSPEAVFDELRRATAGARADYSGITLREDPPRTGRVLALSPDPPRTTRARRACSPSALRSPTASARFQRRPPPAGGRGARRRVPALLHDRPLQGALQLRRADPAGRRAGRRQAGAARADSPAPGRTLGVVPGGDAGRREPARQRDVRRSSVSPDIRADTLFAPFHWGGKRCGEHPDQPGPRSQQPDARVQGVRRAGARRRRRDPATVPQPMTPPQEADWRSSATGWRPAGCSTSCLQRDALAPLRRRVFGEERGGAYNRILLSKVLAGEDPDAIVTKPPAWYDERGVALHDGVVGPPPRHGGQAGRDRRRRRATATTSPSSRPAASRWCRRSTA